MAARFPAKLTTANKIRRARQLERHLRSPDRSSMLYDVDDDDEKCSSLKRSDLAQLDARIPGLAFQLTAAQAGYTNSALNTRLLAQTAPKLRAASNR